MTDLERQMVVEMTKIRENPLSLIPHLEKRLQYFKGNVYQAPGCSRLLRTFEGPKAVQEAINYCKAA